MRDDSVIYFWSKIARRARPTIGGEFKFTLETSLQPLRGSKFLFREVLYVSFVLIHSIKLMESNYAIHETVRIFTTVEK